MVSKVDVMLGKVLKKIKPSSTELRKDSKIVDEVFDKLKSATPSDVKVILVGSVAKGTQLKKKMDFDIFLLFPKTYSKKDIEIIGLGSARKAFMKYKRTLAYAEHPYTKIIYKGYDIDCVPAYNISNIKEKGTAVDRSPLHSEYINSHLTLKQKDDVRLLKQFMRNNNIYGAELKIEGFSGYLAELLIVKYSSLTKLFNEVSKWNIPETFDIEGHGNVKAYDSPLVVIDPVDPDRNVGAVVSTTTMSRFIFYVREFINKPLMKHFVSIGKSNSKGITKKKNITKPKLKKIIQRRKTELLILEFDAPSNLVDDVLWPQLKKTVTKLESYFRKNDFQFFGYYYWSDGTKCIIMFEFLIYKLPAVKRLKGPRITMEKNVMQFRYKHKTALDMHIEHDSIVVVKERELLTVKQTLSSALKQSLGIPKKFLVKLKKHKKLKIDKLLCDRYYDLAVDYFTRTIN